MVVLPVEVDQILAKLAKRGNLGEFASDAALGSPFRQHFPLDEQGAILDIDPEFLAPPSQLRLVGKIDDNGDGGFRSSGPDQLGIGPLAESQLDSVDEERFTRSGLSGEHCETGTERDLRALDDRDILDGQLNQHRFRVL